MDRKQLSRTEHDYGLQLRNRLMTPEAPPTDYSYVSYHDSSNGRSSQSRDVGGAPRSILKNKQTTDSEPRTSGGGESGNGRGLDGGTGPVRSVIDRLRRHLSLEKSASPQRQTQQNAGVPSAAAASLPAPYGAGSQRELQIDSSLPKEDSPKKKRSLLSFNRRRTSEVRMGADGKLITNGYDDSQYKRPSSPIDKIKSLFRKGDTSPQSSQHSTIDYHVPSRYTSAGSVEKNYSSYPSTNAGATREVYVPQYRKYPGSSSRDAASALNRYSYTPGLTEQRRHWYDDHNMF